MNKRMNVWLSLIALLIYQCPHKPYNHRLCMGEIFTHHAYVSLQCFILQWNRCYFTKLFPLQVTHAFHLIYTLLSQQQIKGLPLLITARIMDSNTNSSGMSRLPDGSKLGLQPLKDMNIGSNRSIFPQKAVKGKLCCIFWEFKIWSNFYVLALFLHHLPSTDTVPLQFITINTVYWIVV